MKPGHKKKRGIYLKPRAKQSAPLSRDAELLSEVFECGSRVRSLRRSTPNREARVMTSRSTDPKRFSIFFLQIYKNEV